MKGRASIGAFLSGVRVSCSSVPANEMSGSRYSAPNRVIRAETRKSRFRSRGIALAFDAGRSGTAGRDGWRDLSKVRCGKKTNPHISKGDVT